MVKAANLAADRLRAAAGRGRAIGNAARALSLHGHKKPSARPPKSAGEPRVD